jgi:hypothetical protein
MSISPSWDLNSNTKINAKIGQRSAATDLMSSAISLSMVVLRAIAGAQWQSDKREYISHFYAPPRRGPLACRSMFPFTKSNAMVGHGPMNQHNGTIWLKDFAVASVLPMCRPVVGLRSNGRRPRVAGGGLFQKPCAKYPETTST